MVPFVDATPDPRLMERLHGQLYRNVSAASFVAAADALALAVLAPHDPARREWMEALADGMVGVLLRVQDATMDDASPDDRVRLARSAAVLSIVRPQAAAACDAAASVWLGWGLPDVDRHSPAKVLAARALLALFFDDLQGAEGAVEGLQEHSLSRLGAVVHHWVLARKNGRGTVREEGCFDTLRALLDQPEHSDPALILLGSLVLHTQRMGLNRQRLLAWVNRLAPASGQEVAARRSA